MMCNDCIDYFVNKLQKVDLILLEYLLSKGAVTPQFSLSRQTLQSDNNLSMHITISSIHRLSLLDLIGEAKSSRTTKYYISRLGVKSLAIIENKIKDLTL